MPNRLKLENRTASRIRIGNPKARSGKRRQVKALKLPASTVVSYILVNVDSRASQSVITKLGHISKDCYNKKTPQQVNYATQVEAAPTMFYASNASGAGVTRDEEI
ncbi:hypothetical protein L3X38_012080 [Prunus dulcis]|uniref:Uncharacterized protein n=1 Tax=Prunus dulcis TaxID=3755 RepID=A0AAD4WJC9_PRUDU|nr:hypothetical protein L3X38_012080 [Prunus dulcis]